MISLYIDFHHKLDVCWNLQTDSSFGRSEVNCGFFEKLQALLEIFWWNSPTIEIWLESQRFAERTHLQFVDTFPKLVSDLTSFLWAFKVWRRARLRQGRWKIPPTSRFEKHQSPKSVMQICFKRLQSVKVSSGSKRVVFSGVHCQLWPTFLHCATIVNLASSAISAVTTLTHRRHSCRHAGAGPLCAAALGQKTNCTDHMPAGSSMPNICSPLENFSAQLSSLSSGLHVADSHHWRKANHLDLHLLHWVSSNHTLVMLSGEAELAGGEQV